MRRYALITTLIIIVLTAIILIPVLTGVNLNPFKRDDIVTRTAQNIETVQISTYNSAKYSYKAIFPYDFIYGEPNWTSIIYKNVKTMSKEEQVNYDFYFACLEAGIDLSNFNNFFTITAVATAGFNMEEYLIDPIEFNNPANKLIILKEPKAEITSLTIEDRLREDDFPGVKITPGEWQKLISFLLPEIEDRILETGFLESADKGNRNFLQKLYYSIGWERVQFR